jgi:hypothetical protein
MRTLILAIVACCVACASCKQTPQRVDFKIPRAPQWSSVAVDYCVFPVEKVLVLAGFKSLQERPTAERGFFIWNYETSATDASPASHCRISVEMKSWRAQVVVWADGRQSTERLIRLRDDIRVALTEKYGTENVQ